MSSAIHPFHPFPLLSPVKIFDVFVHGWILTRRLCQLWSDMAAQHWVQTLYTVLWSSLSNHFQLQVGRHTSYHGNIALYPVTNNLATNEEQTIFAGLYKHLNIPLAAPCRDDLSFTFVYATKPQILCFRRILFLAKLKLHLILSLCDDSRP